MSERVLVFGATGRVGQAIVPAFEQEFEVIAPKSSEVDITNVAQVRQIIQKYSPKTVINSTMSSVSVDDAEKPQNHTLVYKINTEGAGIVASEASKVGAYTLYYGTDYVFDGNLVGRLYNENDPKNPLSVYGKSKSQGEDLVLEFEKGTVIRFSTPFSDTMEGSPDILKYFYNQLKAGKEIQALEDTILTPTPITNVVKATREWIRAPQSGIWHVAGTPLSPLNIALLLADLCGFNKDLIKPIKFAEYRRPAPRPKNGGLDVSKFSNHYGNLLSTEDGIKKFVENLER